MRNREASKQNDLGMNRTGMQMSPQDSKELLETAEATMPGDPQALAVLRGRYIADADPLGSVPLPGSLKGAVVQGAKLLQGKHPEVLMDKLSERLAFERGGTRLYDALITKFNAATQAAKGITLEELSRIRGEEADHMRMLTETIRALGGDPTSQTPGADLVGIESAGLVQAVNDPRIGFAQSLHALLIAELADLDGWNVLIALAEQGGEDEIAQRFRAARDQEEEHLRKVRTWYERTVLNPA